MHIRIRIGRALVASGLLLAACDSARSLWTPPEVRFRGVALEGIGPLGGQLRVRLLVRNPNAYALTETAVRYHLFTRDTIAVADGSDAERRSVLAHDSVSVELPVAVSWRGVQAAGGALVAQGTVPYRLAGDITLDTPIGLHTVPFDERGQFAPGRTAPR